MNRQFYILFLLCHCIYIFNCTDITDFSDDPAPSVCEKMLESFAYVTGNFTYCAIQNARPIRLCTKCVDMYLLVRSVYSDISNIDPTSGEFCRDKIFNLDRLQIVDTGFVYVTNLWARASCDSCFIMDGTNWPTPQLISGVEQILNVSAEFQDCVKNYTNASSVHLYDPLVCKGCLSFYSEINTMYNGLKGTAENPICMDIVDMVNSTRIEWSTTLGCYVDKKGPEIIYLIITGIVALVPVFFYFCAWGLISKKQQIINLHNNFSGYLRPFHSQMSQVSTVSR